MPMQYPPLADGTYRYGDDPRPLPSPVPGPDPGTDPQFQAPDLPHPGTPHPAEAQPGSDGSRSSGALAAASIVGGLGLVVLVFLGMALFGPGSDRGTAPAPGGGPALPGPAPDPFRIPDTPPGEPFTVEGLFTIASSPDEPVSGDSGGCTLPPSMSDIGEGSRITLTDGTQTAVDSVQLAYDQGDLSSCTFSFEFADVPSGSAFYIIELQGRGQLFYTEEELRAGVEITLGR